jgi:hypothetical protein
LLGRNDHARTPLQTLGMIAAILVALILTTERAVAVSAWVNISNNAGASTYPSLGLDGTMLIAMWVDNTPGNDEIFMARSADTGAIWGTPVDLSLTSGASSMYDWAFAGRYLYVVWADGSPADIVFRRSVDGGLTFKAAWDVSVNSGQSTVPRVALSGGSNVYLTWQDDTTGNDEVYFKRSLDAGQTFGNVMNLSNTADSSEAPSIYTLGPHVWVLWTEVLGPYFHPDIYLRHSSNGGATFGSTVVVSPPAGDSVDPSMAVAGPNVYVVWTDLDSITTYDQPMFRVSSDGGASFGAVTVLSNSFSHKHHPFIMVAGTFVYVTWADGDWTGGNEIYLRRSIDKGATWQAVRNLSNSAGSSIASAFSWTLAGTQLYVAWPDTTPGNWEIFYRKSNDTGASFNSTLNLSMFAD